jgi:hypothetical protein
MMGTQTIKRLRPDFGLKDLVLHEERGETSYLPDEFAPHTVTATISADHQCNLSFEYSINEDSGANLVIDAGSTVSVGKYSGKILRITVSFSSRQDLIQRFLVVAEFLGARQKLLPKLSYQKHYEIVVGTLLSITNEMRDNPEMIRL